MPRAQWAPICVGCVRYRSDKTIHETSTNNSNFLDIWLFIREKVQNCSLVWKKNSWFNCTIKQTTSKRTYQTKSYCLLLKIEEPEIVIFVKLITFSFYFNISERTKYQILEVLSINISCSYLDYTSIIFSSPASSRTYTTIFQVWASTSYSFWKSFFQLSTICENYFDMIQNRTLQICCLIDDPDLWTRLL